MNKVIRMCLVTTQAHEGIETEDELVAYQKAAAVTTQAHEGIETWNFTVE